MTNQKETHTRRWFLWGGLAALGCIIIVVCLAGTAGGTYFLVQSNQPTYTAVVIYHRVTSTLDPNRTPIIHTVRPEITPIPTKLHPNLPDDVPILENATSVDVIGNQITYLAVSSLADAITFYNENLPLFGWW